MPHDRDALRVLVERVDAAKGDDWQLDADILEALGWQVRRIGRLGLTGRTRGSERAWPPGSSAKGGYTPPRPTESVIDAIKLTRRHAPGAAAKGTALEQCRVLLTALLAQAEAEAGGQHVG